MISATNAARGLRRNLFGRAISVVAIAISACMAGRAFAGIAQAQAPSGQGSLRPSAIEQYCDEERQQAEQWMLWAAQKRSECATAKTDFGTQQACLQHWVQQLHELEKEYAAIYTSQMSNLRHDHPVMTHLLSRLKSHKELASAVLLRAEAQPEAMAEQLKASCLASAPQPPARSRRR